MADKRNSKPPLLPRKRTMAGQSSPRDRTPEFVPKEDLPTRRPKTGFIHARIKAAAQTAEKNVGGVEAARSELIYLLRGLNNPVAEATAEMLDPDRKTDIRLDVVLGWKEHSQLNRDRLIAAEMEGRMRNGEKQGDATSNTASRWKLSKSSVRRIWHANRAKIPEDEAFRKDADCWDTPTNS